MSKTPPTAPGAIDPVMMARFLVLPRADELLEAFALIPPGRLRDTVVEHAKALAEAHSNVPAAHRFPDPLPAALGQPQAPRALPRRTEHEPPTSDPKTKAVQMRLEGKQAWQVAKATGLTISAVYAAITDARKAGVQFPKIGRASPGKNSKYSPKTVYTMTVEEIGEGRAMSAITRAAEKRGIDVEAYMSRRKLALEMALAGRHFRAIMEATKEDRVTLGAWFSNARAAGHPVPYMFDGAPGAVRGSQRRRRPEPTPQNVIDMERAAPVRPMTRPHRASLHS